jgi:chromosome segregation ATPase
MSSFGSGQTVAESVLALLSTLSDLSTHTQRLKEFAEAENAAHQASNILTSQQQEHARIVAELDDRQAALEVLEQSVRAKDADLTRKLGNIDTLNRQAKAGLDHAAMEQQEAARQFNANAAREARLAEKERTLAQKEVELKDKQVVVDAQKAEYENKLSKLRALAS